MRINFTNKTNIDVKIYKDLIRSVFKTIKNPYFFNIIFVSKEEIQLINKTYRQIDRVTDVITFALMENQDEIFGEASNELGDVFICLERAFEQAEEYGHSVLREVGFLSVHGYLHLMGYDHQTKEEEKTMFDLQEKILNDAGLYRGD